MLCGVKDKLEKIWFKENKDKTVEMLNLYAIIGISIASFIVILALSICIINRIDRRRIIRKQSYFDRVKLKPISRTQSMESTDFGMPMPVEFSQKI